MIEYLIYLFTFETNWIFNLGMWDLCKLGFDLLIGTTKKISSFKCCYYGGNLLAATQMVLCFYIWSYQMVAISVVCVLPIWQCPILKTLSCLKAANCIYQGMNITNPDILLLRKIKSHSSVYITSYIDGGTFISTLEFCEYQFQKKKDYVNIFILYSFRYNVKLADFIAQVIPSKFAADHLGERAHDIILRRPNRKEKWLVSYYYSCRTRCFHNLTVV